jgi:hypothetical protein
MYSMVLPVSLMFSCCCVHNDSMYTDSNWYHEQHAHGLRLLVWAVKLADNGLTYAQHNGVVSIVAAVDVALIAAC